MPDYENLPHHCIYCGAILDDDGYCPTPIIINGKEKRIKPEYVMYPDEKEDGSTNG